MMAGICTRAFFDDDLFGRVIHPQRTTYPNDVQIYWHEWLRHDWASLRSKIMVAVTEPDHERDQERIIGVAIWERQGGDVGAQRALEDFAISGPWPALKSTWNRALDPSKKTILQDSEMYIKQYWAGPCATNWYLALCCVDPEYQQRGCGRLLTSWGLKRAKEEGIRASVIASDGSTDFYLKCGFDEIVGNASREGGEGNPMMKDNVKGGDIMFTWLENDVKSESA
jgi:GNAT superfamily N-acetyltransferase